jgi:hypothetical protein
VGGHYLLNDIDVMIFGEKAIPLGFENESYTMALISQPEAGWGKEFVAFVIPRLSRSIERVSKDRYLELRGESCRARIEVRARKVFQDSGVAANWLATPNNALGAAPVDLLDTTEGLARVERALTRIEHGA